MIHHPNQLMNQYRKTVPNRNEAVDVRKVVKKQRQSQKRHQYLDAVEADQKHRPMTRLDLIKTNLSFWNQRFPQTNTKRVQIKFNEIKYLEFKRKKNVSRI